MPTPQLYRKSQSREFFPHHALLHAAKCEIADAIASQVGRFNRCLAAMSLTALSLEALVNAVGSRVVQEWTPFERLSPLEKLDVLVGALRIDRNANQEPWSTLRFLAGFRNAIAHPKPELVEDVRLLPEAGLHKTWFDAPQSSFEKVVTLGNAQRVFSAVYSLKGLLTDALPANQRFGIFADMWTGTTGLDNEGSHD